MRARLLATSVAAVVLGASSAQAQDATWRAAPLTGTFNNPLNWTPVVVPQGTATFGASTITGLTFLVPSTIGGFTFNAGAPAYSFNIPVVGSIFVTGAGITNNSSNSPSFFLAPTATLVFENNSSAGNATFTNAVGGTLTFQDTSSAGSATINNNGSVAFIGNSTAASAAITNNGLLTFGGASTAANATVQTTNGGVTQFLATAAGGQARFVTDAGGAFSIVLASNPVTVGSIEGAGTYFLGGNQLTTGSNNLSTTVSGTIFGLLGGSLVKTGGGTLTLSGINAYTGPTAVNAGSLIVDGSIAASSLTTVASGATLGGNGTVGTTLVSTGATFAPGPSGAPGTMTVAGNLTFQPGSMYVVNVTPMAASTTNVSGRATLAGTVQANFGAGTFLEHTYTILTATGGRNGTFDALATSGLPADFKTSLTYPGNTAVLNLTADLIPPVPPLPPTPPLPPLSINQRNVANAIDNFFNNGGALPPAFVPLFGLSGSNLANALSQLSGEAATGAQKVAFQLTDEFLSLMLDPFVDGRSGIGGADHPALGFAPERETTLPESALDYAAVFKAVPFAPPVYEPRWTAWGGSYGGVNHTSGDPAGIGSHDLSANTVGMAGGLDYRLTPNTAVGFALAGGGTDWSLAQGLGGGRSDAFQVGVYGATRAGPAYLAAAFAFANHWMSTSRFAFGDTLTADFDAQSYGGRLEAGYRFATPWAGIAPYTAIQVQDFHTPNYRETDAITDGFALAYPSRDATDTRSELGARFDRVVSTYPDAVLALRGRLAWAHDWVSDLTLTPLFEALPGASFVVNGATPAQDSLLTSVGAELRLASGITLLAKFEGEFASREFTYGGTGAVRYTW
jgi:autotransporter-associated beta strand protein